MKRPLLIVGLLGLVGCFLPFFLGVSWFEMRHFDEGWTVWLVMLAFAIPAFIGASSDDIGKPEALVTAGCFAYLAYKFNIDVFSLLFHASIGGILMGVAMLAGFALSALLVLGALNKR